MSTAVPSSSSGEKPRTQFIDHLRVLLTALVVFHHTAITYGAPGGWYYHEPAAHGLESTSALLLTMFVAVNQAYFMGFFFLLAGYFTPASLAKKGGRAFLLDRVIRLGIPLVIYGFLLGPLTAALSATAKGTPFFTACLALAGRFMPGPLWFAEALLIFTCAYVLAQVPIKHAGRNASSQDRLPGHFQILIAAIAVGSGALLLRQWMPVGHEVFSLQFGYFSSYIFLFFLGCLSWRQRWLERVESGLALPWLFVSAGAILFFAVTTVAGRTPHRIDIDVSGGLGISAVIYAYFEPLAAWGIILTLLWQFRQRFNNNQALVQELARRAYTVYIIHPPILVALSLLVCNCQMNALLKFPLVATVACLACVVVAGLLLKIPGARRILG